MGAAGTLLEFKVEPAERQRGQDWKLEPAATPRAPVRDELVTIYSLVSIPHMQLRTRRHFTVPLGFGPVQVMRPGVDA